MATEGIIDHLSYWTAETDPDWLVFDPANPPQLLLGESIALCVWWLNTGSENIIGDISLTLVAPDASIQSVPAVLYQGGEAAPGYGFGVGFAEVVLDQIGQYQADITLTGIVSILGVRTDGVTELGGESTDTSVRMLGYLDSLGSDSSVKVSFDYGTTMACDQVSTYDKTFSSPIYFGIPVYGLSPGTTYYFRAKAVGLDTGDVAYGDVMIFTTTGVPVYEDTQVLALNSGAGYEALNSDDGDASYILCYYGYPAYYTMFGFEEFTAPHSKINSVTVYVKDKLHTQQLSPSIFPAIESSGVYARDSYHRPGFYAGYELHSETFITDPSTGLPWTKAGVDAATMGWFGVRYPNWDSVVRFSYACVVVSYDTPI